MTLSLFDHAAVETATPSPGELRDYQRDAIAAIVHELSGHRRSTLVEMPTGCGKTVVFAKIAEWAVNRGQRVLVLAHRDTLVRQAVDKIQRWTGLPVAVEKAEERAARSAVVAREELLRRQPVVVGSVQSMQRRRLQRFAPDEFGLIIADEAHHAVSPSWRAILDHFAAAQILGVTATPDRLDAKALGQVFESLAYRYDLTRAIDAGHLVPIRQHQVLVDGLDLRRVRSTAGDFNARDLAAVMQEERHLHAVADPIYKLAGDRPTLIFATTVQHAELLADQINRRAEADGLPTKRATTVHGKTADEDRERIFAGFERGEFQFLSSCAMLLEGFDCPPIACVAMARPTKSRALYVQAVGRGTRLHPGKADLIVLDFVGNAGRHQLVTAVDIFDGDLTPIERALADEIARTNPGLGARDIAELARRRAEEEERKRKALEERKNVIAEARVRTFQVDAVGMRAIGMAPVQPVAGPDARDVTPKQAGELRAFGYPEKDLRSLDYHSAKALIFRLRQRRRDRLATYKQARWLLRLGVERPETVSKARASEILDVAAKNGWRLPGGFLSAGREREPGEEG